MGIDEAFRQTGEWSMNRLPTFQHIWHAFKFLVARRFGAGTSIDEETGYADAAGIAVQVARHLRPNAESQFPLVIYETDFCHSDGIWRPWRRVLIGVPREQEFLAEVKWFFEVFCRSEGFTLAGIEEPRTAARRFSAVNYFTMMDNIRIDVKEGDLYRKDRFSGKWTLIYSNLCICPLEDFEELSSISNDAQCEAHARDKAPRWLERATAMSEAMDRCQEWLEDYAVALENGETEYKRRDQLKAEAVREFDISRNGFDRVWPVVIERHTTLKKPGPRPKNRN